MKVVVNYKGWFKFILSGGDLAEMEKATGQVPVVADVLAPLKGAAEFAVLTRKGWHTLRLPDVGQITWKTGLDFRTGSEFLFVRVNGRKKIHAWPEPGAKQGWLDRMPLREVM